jgi:hypothetical protein
VTGVVIGLGYMSLVGFAAITGWAVLINVLDNIRARRRRRAQGAAVVCTLCDTRMERGLVELHRAYDCPATATTHQHPEG